MHGSERDHDNEHERMYHENEKGSKEKVDGQK